MYLIEPESVPVPADAERLLADLWQLTVGRSFGLYLFGFQGSRVMLGVHSSEPRTEEVAASTISDHCGGAVEPGRAIPQLIDLAENIAAINMVPTDRHLALDSTTFGWQRTDPLRGAYNILANLTAGEYAGVGITLRSLPNLEFLLSMSTFATGSMAQETAMRVASSYAGIGVRLRHPLRQRRVVRQMLDGALRRPATVKRVEVATLFWHPPYGSTDVPVIGKSLQSRENVPLLPRVSPF